jgi:hypothetical protein
MAAFSSTSPGGPYTIAKKNALFMACVCLLLVLLLLPTSA